MTSDASQPRAGTEATLHEIVNALRSEAKAESGAPSAPCPLCCLTQRSVERALRLFLAEFVNDPQLRLELRRSRGFCASHALLLSSLGEALAVAILYADLTEQTQQRWKGRKRRPVWAGWLPQKMRMPKAPHLSPCPACAAAQEAEHRYARALAENLEAPEVWSALETGNGLCVPHCELVLELAPPEGAKRLHQLESQRLKALQTELEEMIRKNDYRFRQEPWGEEKDAWLRALHKLIRPKQKDEL